jgi:hypothetical protein
LGSQRKRSQNGRIYEGESLLITKRWRNVSRLKSFSCNLVWVPVSFGSNSFIFCSVYLPPETRNFNDEDTREILENEMGRFSE